MIEPTERPIPVLAKTAIQLLNEDFARRINAVASETLDAMGLKASDGWQVDVVRGVAILPAKKDG